MKNKSKLSILVISAIVVVVIWIIADKVSEQESVATTSVQEPAAPSATEEAKVIKFALEPKSDGSASGEVTFIEKNGQVEFSAKLSGLSEGVHAIHIHEKADCSATDGTSTGGHWNPTFKNHSKWGDTNGYHKGDIGNFTVDANGEGFISLTTDEWCIGCGDESKDIIGKAVIVHQGEDDFISQPSGNAGSRVSCAAIIN